MPSVFTDTYRRGKNRGGAATWRRSPPAGRVLFRRASRRYRFQQDQSGATALEFGLVGAIFFLISFSALDLGRYFLTLTELRVVTNAAARAALVDCYKASSCQLSSTQIQAIEASEPFLNADSLNLTINQTMAATGATTMNVTGAYPFTFLLPVWQSYVGIKASVVFQY